MWLLHVAVVVEVGAKERNNNGLSERHVELHEVSTTTNMESTPTKRCSTIIAEGLVTTNGTLDAAEET